jgi:hypothetical protein
MFKDLAGNTPAQAYDFGSPKTGRVTDKVNAFVGTSDPNDFYKFKLTRSSSITLTLRNRDRGDADLELIDAIEKPLFASRRGANQRDRITSELNPGTYYIRVFPKAGPKTSDVQYKLILKIVQKF